MDTLVVSNSEMIEAKKESLTLCQQAQQLAVEIKNDAGFKAAADFLLRIKEARKKANDIFGPLVKKAHEAWKEAVSLRNQVDDPLDRAEQIIKPAMARYQVIRDQKRKEMEEKLRATAEEKGLPAPILPPAEKVAGISSREIWKFEVTDLMALVQAVVKKKVPISAIEPNTKVLGEMARSLKDQLNWPGVGVYSETTIAARSEKGGSVL